MSMPSLPSVLHHGQRRVRWEAYLFRTGLYRRLWDMRGARPLQRQLPAACVFDKTLDPCVSADDPIFQDPFIRREERIPRRTYLYHFREKAVIEPDYGFVIADPSAIVELSLQGSHMARNRATVHFLSGVPSMRRHRAAKRETHPTHKEDVVITIRHVWDQNYYHFFIDMMACLKIVDDYGVDPSVPIVISPGLARQKFFRELCQRGKLARRSFLVQDRFPIRANEVIFAKPNIGNRAELDYFLDYIDAPCGDARQQRRVFLTRDPKSGRNIANMDAILPVLQRWNFELVDTGQIPVAEQMRLFQETAVLIGIHGAGMTNMMYRRDGGLKVLEIFPPYEGYLHYYQMANLYGFDYHHLRGHSPSEASRRSPFQLDPTLLDTAIREMLC